MPSQQPATLAELLQDLEQDYLHRSIARLSNAILCQPPFLRSCRTVIVILLFAKCSLQLLFLFLGQVRSDQLELVTLELLEHFVLHRAAGHQEQRRGAFGNLLAGLIDQVIIDAVVGHLAAQRAHSGADCQAQERDEEDQPKEHAPEGALHGANASYVGKQLGLGGFFTLIAAAGVQRSK